MTVSNKDASWETTANVSRDVLEQSIPKQWLLGPERLPAANTLNVLKIAEQSGILGVEEVEMTRQNIDGLLSNYKSGRWTVEAVTIAFLKRAAISHQLAYKSLKTNFATEFLADSALETARAQDKHFQMTGNLVGPLHGIPISVKEHVAIGGKICHASFVSKIDNIATHDALIVQLLKKAGGIVHVRTNQPQSIMHLDCTNNITGTTLNPLNRLLSPGGSSGGEGASVATRSSLLGVGTDIGGSVRVPAAFCGVYGFKPTTLRNPALGLVGAMGGQEHLRGCVGPLAQSVDDIIVFQKAVWNQEPWDIETSLVPLPWRETTSPTGLTVGIMLDDGIVKPHPPVTRALVNAERLLSEAGIKTIRWEPYRHAEAWDIAKALYFADAGERVRAVLAASGEPILPLTELALSRAEPQALSIHECWSWNMKREALRRDYHALMKERGVDVILCPSYVGAGVLLGEPRCWRYTAMWNVLDQPCISFPSGIRVDEAVDSLDESHTPRSEEDEWEGSAYDPSLFHGLPISLQLVGKHHRDEELLAVAKRVESILKSSA